MSVEIAGSPLSRHDLDVIRRQLIRVRTEGFDPTEVIVSARRVIVTLGLRVAGVPLRTSSLYALNDGAIVIDGRSPERFDFEELG